MCPLGHGPILERIFGAKYFQLFEPKVLDIILQDRIDDIFDGLVDFDF